EPSNATSGTDCSRSFQNDSGASQMGDFGNYREAAIFGSSYDDLNGNGSRDSGEPGNSGRTIHLDPGTPSDSSDDLSTTTDSNGDWGFTSLKPGITYRAYETLPSGWTHTQPSGSGDYSIPISSGDLVSGRDFGSNQKAAISGTVFHD